jgi:hypothetical protein
MARREVDEGAVVPRPVQVLRCELEECGRVWRRVERPGPAPRFCSDACKQTNYRRVRKLGVRERRAYEAAQHRRRQEWEDHERQLYEAAMSPSSTETAQATATMPGGMPSAAATVASFTAALRQDLERLSVELAAAQADGAGDTAALYQRFADLQAEVTRHAEQLSGGLEDVQAALDLVRVQIAGLLANGTG